MHSRRSYCEIEHGETTGCPWCLLDKVTAERDEWEFNAKALDKQSREDRAELNRLRAVVTNINIGAEQTAERRARVEAREVRLKSMIWAWRNSARGLLSVLDRWDPETPAQEK